MREPRAGGVDAKAASDARARFVRAAADIRFDAARWGEGLATTDVERLVMPRPPVNPVPETAGMRELVQALALDPVYQLK